jgi:hypothetical protein
VRRCARSTDLVLGPTESVRRARPGKAGAHRHLLAASLLGLFGRGRLFALVACRRHLIRPGNASGQATRTLARLLGVLGHVRIGSSAGFTFGNEWWEQKKSVPSPVVPWPTVGPDPVWDKLVKIDALLRAAQVDSGLSNAHCGDRIDDRDASWAQTARDCHLFGLPAVHCAASLRVHTVGKVSSTRQISCRGV